MRYRNRRISRILNNQSKNGLKTFMRLTRLTFTIATLLFIGVQAANAACYADYKAKQDDPLRLHYGVIKLPDGACSSKSAAKGTIAKKISQDGWKLLSVMDLFDKDGLDKRKERAGTYYLKY